MIGIMHGLLLLEDVELFVEELKHRTEDGGRNSKMVGSCDIFNKPIPMESKDSYP